MMIILCLEAVAGRFWPRMPRDRYLRGLSPEHGPTTEVGGLRMIR
jgi:hypothetical protein